ncbi:MAG TPA: LLM class F420-dependent oxidoreductase [Gaiellaceae bacterium]|jgi:probable F420-dependent oxidoreductase|nr:LLM class F420-dependent oxidoreductase [Gaiellaceae bacterium]
MRIGVVFPQTEIGADPAGVRAYAEAVQELGFTHLTSYDHVLGADPAGHPGFSGPYTSESMFHEPFVLYGYLAAVAPRLELVTGIVILPQRQTALVAKQAAEVDILTGGRFRLGVGQGWNTVEYEALGADWPTRGKRFEEQIELLRRLWQEPVLDFEGRFHTITATGINPLPVQRPIPIWMGGSSEPALKRIARLADGYFPLSNPLEECWAATLERMRGWREEAGRDPDDFGIEARIDTATGTPEDWHRAAEEWRTLGATHLSINTMRGGLEGPGPHIRRLTDALDAVTGA